MASARNTFHCDLGQITGTRTPAVTASRLVSEPGLYERTFHPERAKLWVKNESEKSTRSRYHFNQAEFV